MIHICFVTNDVFSQFCQICIHEIIAHKKPDTEIFIHILADKLLNKNDFDIFKNISKISLEIIDITNKDIIDKNVKYNTRYNCFEPFDRYIIPELVEFKNIDRILYLDADIIVKKDLTELYESNLNGKMLGGVVSSWNMSTIIFDPYFINAGVLLMDLNKARQKCFTRKCIVNTTPDLNDELVINHIFKHDTEHLPIIYNVFYSRILINYPYARDISLFNKNYKTKYSSIKELIKDAAILHIAGDKLIYSKNPIFSRFRKYYYDRLDNFKKTKTIINDSKNELEMLLDLS